MSLYVIASSGLVIWSDLKFDTLTHVVAFLTTNFGVALAMVAAVYLNFQLPSAYRTRCWMIAGSCAALAGRFADQRRWGLARVVQ